MMRPGSSFVEWRNSWSALGAFQGPRLPSDEERARSDRLLALWKESIPRGWERPNYPSDVLDPAARYRRGDKDQPSGPERLIEHQLLTGPLEETTCMGTGIVDGINAIPLVQSRQGLIADVFLLLRGERGYELAVVEVKAERGTTAWSAVIQNLCQLRLITAGATARRIFHQRWPALRLPDRLPVRGLVLAPPGAYEASGQHGQSVDPARRLAKRVGRELDVHVELAVWQPTSRAIVALQ